VIYFKILYYFIYSENNTIIIFIETDIWLTICTQIFHYKDIIVIE